jgi:hypothetical protein
LSFLRRIYQLSNFLTPPYSSEQVEFIFKLAANYLSIRFGSDFSRYLENLTSISLFLLGYGVHTSLLTLPYKLLIPPTPLKKGGKSPSKSPNLSGDLGGSSTILVFYKDVCTP